MTLVSLDAVSFAYGRGDPVLEGVSFAVEPGTSVGLVGESGSGKSTILKLLLGLERPAAGTMRFGEERIDAGDRAFMARYRRAVQAVFQDPYSSLDPRHTVSRIVSEPLRALKIEGDRHAAVAQALHEVGLDEDAMGRYPHAFSGGQRQRIAIARALVARPQLILADEAVSALDLSTRIRIVELLRTIAQQTTLLLISHDLGVVAALCEEIVVLEKGRVVETGKTRDILANPQHAYTRRLLESVPRMPG